MAINSGSRYEQSNVDFFSKVEGGIVYPIVFYSFDSLDNVSFFYHSYRKGETLHALAQRYFRDPSLWWTIAEYNPEVVDLLRIPDNTLLRIPSV